MKKYLAVLGLGLIVWVQLFAILGVNVHTSETAGIVYAQEEPQECIDDPGSLECQVALDEQQGDVGRCDTGSINLMFKILICPAVWALFNGIQFMYETIVENLLIISPIQDSGGGPGEVALFDIWNSFRILANIMFIFVFIVAILGQTFSWFLTPYELKKIIPRLFIGAIAIQLSWYIVGFTIDVFNVIGAGLRGLILGPVRGLDANVALDFSGGLSGFGAELLSQIALAYGTYLTFVNGGGIISGLFMLLLPIAIALIAAFIVLLLRRSIIYILIVISPLAFLAWILPNTADFGRQWWSFFWKILIMYPLIVLLISGGEFVAALVNVEQNFAEDGVAATTDGIGRAIVSMIALFGPYFAIPLTFRFAGGFLAGISGSSSRLSRRIDQAVFGHEGDKDSFRGSRARRKADRRAQRREGVVDRVNAAGGRAEDYSGRRRGTKRGTFAGWAGTGIGWAGSKLYRENIDELVAADQRAEEDLQERTSNGPDDWEYAFASPDGVTHPVSGEPLRPDQVAIGQALRGEASRNQAFARVANKYVLGKLNEADYEDDPNGRGYQHARDNFINNYSRKGVLGNDYIARQKRIQLWDEMVNKNDVTRKYGTAKHQDHEDGEINEHKRVRTLRDVNGLINQNVMSSQAAMTWDDINSVAHRDVTKADGRVIKSTQTKAQEARAAAIAAGASEDNWYDYLDRDSKEEVLELRKMQKGLQQQNYGGNAEAEKRKQQMLKNLDWIY